MTLKVHMMGPRSAKFPFKAEGSWFIKLDSKIHGYLQDRMIETGETIDEALLGAIMEGIAITKKEQEQDGPLTLEP